MALGDQLLPVLRDIIDWHRRGTRYHIGVDPADGLLHAGELGVQLTWMDAEAQDCVYHDPGVALALLQPFEYHLRDAGLGSISEILAGDPPHLPDGCFAQAWGVAEVLRVWRKLEQERRFHPHA